MNASSSPAIMGILNVTPDSFSDGGRYVDTAAALEHARQMRAAGADIIDVGGESTRPGAQRVDPDTEIARVVPVVEALRADGVTVSADTTRAATAEAAWERGASIVNDVSGGKADPEMAPLIARAGCRVVLMHWRGHSEQMYREAEYVDVVDEVRAELLDRVDEMRAAGVRREQLILDPGLGFAKLAEHNWKLLAHLDSLVDLGLPVLFGASRKSFLGKLFPGEQPRPAEQREAATLATSVLAMSAGVWGLRVHDVAATADARAVFEATRSARHLPPGPVVP